MIGDVAAGRYSDLHLATFITACAGDHLDLDETVSLTRAMVDVGERLDWGRDLVVDKHCIGGIPGNRTSMIVVPIIAAHGLKLGKIAQPVRVAVTGGTASPGIFEVLEILGRDRTLARLDAALGRIA